MQVSERERFALMSVDEHRLEPCIEAVPGRAWVEGRQGDGQIKNSWQQRPLPPAGDDVGGSETGQSKTAAGGALKAVIYVRVSSDEQVKNLSLETQKKECLRYCAANGLKVDRIFTEAGESAKTANRPELQAMLSYCRASAGKIGAVVVYNLSRFARNAHDHHAVRHLLSKAGIRLHSACEPIEDSTTGKFFESVLAAVAQLDNDMRGDRAVAGMKMAIEKGRWPFSPPIGYQNARNDRGEPTLVPDPKRAPLIRQAFNLYATGHYTKQQVLKKVTALGLRTVNGNPVSMTTIARVLANPIYAGKLDVPAWKKKGDGNFTPIVSDEIFNRAQLVAHNRKTNTTETHLRDNPLFPLRGSVRCGACGRLLTGFNAKGRTKHYAYYGCYNSKCAGKVRVRKEVLEHEFEAYLERWQPKAGFVRYFRERLLSNWEKKRDVAMLGAIAGQEAVDDIEKKLARLDDLFIDKRAIPQKVYEGRRAKLEEQLVAAKVALHDCQTEDLDIEAAINFACFVMTNAKSLYTQLSVEQKRCLLGVLSPSGFTFDGGSGIKTGASDCVFNHLYRKKEALVRTGTPEVSKLEPSTA